MIAWNRTCGPATAEHRRDILRQEETDRKIEEAKYPTGGHCIGGPTPAALLKPRHVGLTGAEEHAMWLEDISHWQGEYLAILADLERVHTEYEELKAEHTRARRVHERAAGQHQKVMAEVRNVSNAIRDTFRSPRALGRQDCSAKDTKCSCAGT